MERDRGLIALATGAKAIRSGAEKSVYQDFQVNRFPSSPRAPLAPLIVALLAFPSAAGAADRHVSPDGTGNCSSLAASCDLDTAISGAHTGDRIIASPGIHAPTTSIQDPAGVSGVTIVASPGEARPVFDLSSGSLQLTHGTSLSGVDIVADSGRAISAAGGVLEHLRVVVTGSYAMGLQLGDGAVLRNSTVVASGTEAAGISVTAPTQRAELRGVTVLASGTGSAAVQVAPDYPATKAKLHAVNSIIRRVGNAVEVRVSAFGVQESVATLDHVSSDPASQVIDGPGATLTATAVVPGAPQFLDRANGDLRQTALSPTIDAGTSDVNGDGTTDAADTAAAGAFDLDGSARRLGLPDVGADEREMPPLIQAVTPVFADGTGAARITVQPRGLLTDVTADWAFDTSTLITTNAVKASGNDPVVLTIPLGVVSAGVSGIQLRARASNSAGSLVTNASTFEVPTDQVPQPRVEVQGDTSTPTQLPSIVPSIAPSGSGPVEQPPVRSALVLPGALPNLITKDSAQARGTFGFRLRCHHTVSCRGSVALTRLGPVRTDTFKIPPGAERTVQLSLTSGQAARVRKAGKRGLRGLLEVRSLDEGSTWTAVRLFSSRWR